ncbi:copper homeostasis protein CutC [Microbacterium halophytorum]|uniref:copper homeostasis protein CutC n=1 Tax=Microbacterium halophytorum TaxID=2067568 RepID=UPI000CFC48A8|nr:copper homeostasis protein CutC [Microbacterium halophytorum]
MRPSVPETGGRALSFELAVQDVRGLVVAADVRPDRMELCTALSTGGVTPSSGLIEAAVATGVPVHVLVRPREGGFEYDEQEKALIVADSARAVALGAAGVVVGGLADGAIDVTLTTRVSEAVGHAEVTFHRAFDQLADQGAGVDLLADLGVTRVLTSGGAASALEGIGTLRRLAGRARGRVQIMAGAGVTSANAGELAETGVDAVHASAKKAVVERLAVGLGSAASAGEAVFHTADADEARAIKAVLRGER